MKKLLALFLAAAVLPAALGQSTPTMVQKSDVNVISNGPIIIGSGNTLTVASGGTLTLAPGSTFNAPSSPINWSSLGNIPSPTVSLSGDGAAAITLISSGGATGSLTLATVNSNTGSFGSATQVPTITVNGKGLITAVAVHSITPAGIGALAQGNNLSDLASASVARTNLGLVIGATVEAWSSNLDSWALQVPAVFAKLASPTFTGVPAAPTASPGTNTTQIATTAFVLANAPSFTFTTPLVNTGGSVTINQAGASSSGYLSSTDWNTFNGKEPAGSYVTTTTTVNGHALSSNVNVTPTDLGLVIGTNVEAWSANLDTFAANGPSFYVPATRTVNGHALSSNVAVTAADLSLVIGTNVEAWSANLDSWSAKTPYSGTIAVTTGKTGTFTNSLTLSGTDGSTLNMGTGGTLGTAAYTAASAYFPATATVGSGSVVLATSPSIASPTLTGTSSVSALTVNGVTTFSGFSAVNVLAVGSSGILAGIAPSSTSGWVLTSNGTSSQPTFQAIPTPASTPTAFASMTAMKSASTSAWVSGTVITLAGFYNPGDGGGGDFVWEDLDTSTDNGGTLIQVSGVATGRLHRIMPSSNYGSQLPNTTVDIRWFGAIPDVSTDCTPGLLAAENSFIFMSSNETGTLWAPAGQYLLKTKLNLSTGSAGSFNLVGSGRNATIFVCDFASSDTAMWDLGNFATMVSIRDCGFNFQTGSTSLSQYIYIHNTHEMDLDNIRCGNFTGTMFNFNTISAWASVNNIYTANVSGCQMLINGMGGVVSNINLGTGFGQPCLMVENCNALNIHDGQCTGGGPWKSFTGAALVSGSNTFTITQAGHGFAAGDYIYISNATSHSAYVYRWRVASTTSNTITVTGDGLGNPGNDTVTFGAIWCVGYFGGAGNVSEDTESSCYGMIWNTGITAPTSSSSVFLDGNSNGSVHMKFGKFLCDYGLTSILADGDATAAYDGVNSYLYTVITSTPGTFTCATGTSDTAATALVNGNWYCIDFVGTSNFTGAGAGANTVGTIFQATGTTTGTGTAAALTAHSFKVGGFIHITSGSYVGYWKIASTTTYSVTVNSTLNAGTATVQAMEGDTITSSISGCSFTDISSYVGDDFGGIRLEGCSDMSLNNCQFENPGNGADPSSPAHNSLVISDGGWPTPIVDIYVNGCQISTIRQSALLPTWIKNGIVIDGPHTLEVQIVGVHLVGSLNAPFVFTNSATPQSCNLDTDFYRGASCIVRLGSSGQAFTSNVQAALSYAFAQYDPYGMFNPSTPTIITPPVGASVVVATGKLHWTGNPTPVYAIIHHLNSGGTPVDWSEVAFSAQPDNSQLSFTTGETNVNPGDYFDFQVLQVSGSSQTLTNNQGTGFTLEVVK